MTKEILLNRAELYMIAHGEMSLELITLELGVGMAVAIHLMGDARFALSRGAGFWSVYRLATLADIKARMNADRAAAMTRAVANVRANP